MVLFILWFSFSKHCHKITSFGLHNSAEDRKDRCYHPHFTEEGKLEVCARSQRCDSISVGHVSEALGLGAEEP